MPNIIELAFASLLGCVLVYSSPQGLFTLGPIGSVQNAANAFSTGTNVALHAVQLDTYSVEEARQATCREGFQPNLGNNFSAIFTSCQNDLRTPNPIVPENYTIECIRLCQFQRGQFFDKNGNANRQVIFDLLVDEAPDPSGRVIYANDFDACVRATKPKQTYENGCKANLKFSECMVAKNEQSCNRAKAAAAAGQPAAAAPVKAPAVPPPAPPKTG